MNRTSTLLFIGIIVLILTGLYTGYVFWEKSSSETEVRRLDKAISEYQNKVLQFETQEVLKAINAKKTLNHLKEEIIEWSDIIRQIRQTVPSRRGFPLVDILSYSGSSLEDISLNIKTLTDSEEPYFDVADLIKAFNESSYFADAFVPSISAGVDDEGRELLTFVIKMRYLGEEPLELLDLNEPSEPVIDQPTEEELLDATITEILDESLESPETTEIPEAPVLDETEPVLR